MNNSSWKSCRRMYRLFDIEFFKLKNTKYFWVLSILFLIFLVALPISTKLLLDYFTSLGEEFISGYSGGSIPLFDFVDIWQNITYIYKIFSIFLGFIIVISVCNEFSYGTVKQNVIDGLSRTEFLNTKLAGIIGISLIVSLIVFLIGLVMGLLWSPVKEPAFIFKNIEFIPAYFLHLVAFQLFCLMIAMLIKRSGFVIAVLIFYIYLIEPIITALLQYNYDMEFLANLFPMRVIGNIIRNPFPKYILQETTTHVAVQDIVLLLVYAAVFYYLSWRIVNKKDLR